MSEKEDTREGEGNKRIGTNIDQPKIRKRCAADKDRNGWNTGEEKEERRKREAI